ncbi:hypothetical protein LUZ63_005879 [Rhynchospora breviuscula]|uniref:Stress-associated endoplasmic reticulum protein n=1 Tax=Rhynchospora breviuscula TaxID=2022672 RepID=A0A9Q0CNQ7_9POAL|nr:hypothetical protein LUZ63_005879 [Rhynchospora breviuscula]
MVGLVELMIFFIAVSLFVVWLRSILELNLSVASYESPTSYPQINSYQLFISRGDPSLSLNNKKKKLHPRLLISFAFPVSVFAFSHRIMTTSRRLADRKIAKFEKNITKRGAIPETSVKKGYEYPVGPILLGFFVFVVIGSSLFQIIRTATTGGMA